MRGCVGRRATAETSAEIPRAAKARLTDNDSKTQILTVKCLEGILLVADACVCVASAGQAASESMIDRLNGLENG